MSRPFRAASLARIAGLGFFLGPTSALAVSGADAGPPAPPPKLEAGCTDRVQLVSARLPRSSKAEIVLELKRVAGLYRTFVRVHPGPEADQCGRRLSELTRTLGLTWFVDDEQHRSTYPLVREVLALHLELFPNQPSNDLVAFRLGQALADLARDDVLAGLDGTQSWREAARLFARAAALNRGQPPAQPTTVKWHDREWPLGALAARHETVCLLNAANPFEPPNPDQTRAIASVDAFLQSEAPVELRTYLPALRVSYLPARRAMLKAVGLPDGRLLEALVDLATDRAVPPELRRVAIALLARRLADEPTASARTRRLELLLAARAGADGGARARTDACLLRRFQAKARPPLGSECSGPEDAREDWINTGRIR